MRLVSRAIFIAKTDMKTCTYCIADKDESEFYVRDGGNLSSWCRRCIGRRSAVRQAAMPGDQMIRAAKHRAAKAGLAYDLDDHREALRDRVLAGCELSGIPFTIAGARDWDSPSIDRIRPAEGYVIGNVRIILWCLNSLFGYWGEDKVQDAVRAWLATREI